MDKSKNVDNTKYSRSWHKPISDDSKNPHGFLLFDEFLLSDIDDELNFEVDAPLTGNIANSILAMRKACANLQAQLETIEQLPKINSAALTAFSDCWKETETTYGELFTLLGGTLPEPSSDERPTVSPSSSPLTLPAKAPIRWVDRQTFVVDEIEDEHVRQKLQIHPELVQQLRECTPKSALTFLRIVYGDWIEAGLMYQSDLSGQSKTPKNPNPREGLDRALFKAVSNQTQAEMKSAPNEQEREKRALRNYLPSLSKKIDRELENIDSNKIKMLDRVRHNMAYRKKSKKFLPRIFLDIIVEMVFTMGAWPGKPMSITHEVKHERKRQSRPGPLPDPGHLFRCLRSALHRLGRPSAVHTGSRFHSRTFEGAAHRGFRQSGR